MIRRFSAIAGLIVGGLGVLMPLLGAQKAVEDWTQWGGPRRDFTTNVVGLPSAWPEGGPRRLWTRDLGDGYSSIIAKDGIMFTMYRSGNSENVVALEAATGKTLWTFTYDAPKDGIIESFGVGPHSTPLLVRDRVFAIGATAKLHCLKKTDGSLIWSHDLYRDFGAMFRDRGYSASPLAYGDMLILTAGGRRNQSLMAFRQSDGKIVWSAGDFGQSQSSPIVINVDGQDQVVALLAAHVAGFDPHKGKVLWSYPHPTSSKSGLNIATPVWTDNVLFVSSAYDGGTRALRLSATDAMTDVKQLWFHRQMRIAFSTLMVVGDLLVGSSGDLGKGILTAVNRHTGELIWRDRSFGTASFLFVDGKLLLLDDDGDLALVTVSPTGLHLHARSKISEGRSWTVPTLVGTRLYVRNRAAIMAFELGADASSERRTGQSQR